MSDITKGPTSDIASDLSFFIIYIIYFHLPFIPIKQVENRKKMLFFYCHRIRTILITLSKSSCTRVGMTLIKMTLKRLCNQR